MPDTTVFTWDYFIDQLQAINVLDVLDILLVTILLYFVYSFIRDRRAGKLAAGVALLVIVMLLSSLAGLSAMSFIMGNLFQVGFVALIVVFQPELRSALEKMGGESFRGLRNIGETKETQDSLSPRMNELCGAVEQLARAKTGALIVLERSTKLGDIIKTGVTVNADLSNFVLRNIFYNGAPLHDGAVIIRDWRVLAAGCFLPLSGNEDIIKDLGTRHRAGIGMSEESDAVVVIVSEETGNISVAIDGQLKRGYTFKTLKRDLEAIFLPENASEKGVSRIMKNIKREGKERKGGKEEGDHE